MDNKKIYQTRYIISGNIVEQYTYEKNQYKGFDSNNKDGKNRGSDFVGENRGQTLGRARKSVMRAINANTDMDKFLTLTFEENITDLDYSNDEFKKFIKRVNYQVFGTKKSLLKYVAVIEFQKRGAVHYHIACNLPFVDVDKLSKVWGHGFIRLNKIKGDKKRFGTNECDNVGAYICKYMTKDNDDIRLKERKSYLMSRNLNKPVEIVVDVNEKDLLAQVYGLPDATNAYFFKKSSVTGFYYNEFTGGVIYNQYNLKRINNKKNEFSPEKENLILNQYSNVLESV